MTHLIVSSSVFDAQSRSTVLDKIEQLVPDIIARAGEIEKARGLPADLNRSLVEAGAMRMLIPKFYGGLELHPQAVLRVLETLAYADVSVAWTVMVAVGFNLVLGRYPRVTTDALFANGPDVLCRGAMAPHGVAVPQDGGYRISGQWPLASTNYDYKWVISNTVVMENGQPRMLPHGAPDMRLCIVPAEQASFLDTWDAVGLRGSSSHDYVIKDVFVPEKMTTNLFTATSDWNSPIHNLPFGIITGPTHNAVCLGVAQGALKELATLAAKKRPALSPNKLTEDSVFKYKLGELTGRLAVVRHAAYADQLETYELGASKRTPTPIEASKSNVLTGVIHKECMQIVDQCLELSGSTGLYSKSGLQRRWRDMRSVAQHAGGLGMATMRFQLLGGAVLADAAQPA